jgi:predicted amidohydrolase
MKIGFLQFNPKLLDLPFNVNRVAKLIKSVKEVDILALPELANSGYNFQNKEEAFSAAEIPEKSPFVAMLQKEAQRLNALIITGFNEKEENKLYNSALLIDKTGIRGTYRKNHLFYREKEFFSPLPTSNRLL